MKDIGKSFGFVLVDMENGNPKDFRKLSDKFVDQNKKDVLLVATSSDEKFSYLLRTDKGNSNIDCSKILKAAQEIVSGRGGGRPDMAQGSGEEANKNKFFLKVEELLKDL